MSVCKGRSLFGSKIDRRSRKSPCTDVLQKLTFGDSDVDSSFHDVSMDSDISPSRLNDSSGFWDNSCTSPVSSPCTTRIKARICSPIPFHFDEDDAESVPMSPVPPQPDTPPHKKLRALRLYDTPHTPKSLLQKAQRRITRASRSKLQVKDSDNCKNRSLLDPDRPQTNVNPFTPNNNTVYSSGVKRSRKFSDRSFLEDSGGEDLEDEGITNKKLALHEINTSRYNEEFYEVCKLGDGEFGSVYKCVNRLDGCTYAIKKSKTPVAGSVYERNAMNEVYAHAVLGKHQHVVRYYSAWAENDHMFIQNEYCNGGSLADLTTETQLHGYPTEDELKKVLLHVAQGLKYIHSQNLVHLDIKPGNIFICRNVNLHNSPESGLEEDLYVEEEENSEPITYKIGDLGHVTSMTNPVVEEGDCRYLPNEILQEEFDYLPKADIFSLALTIFLVGGGGELPKNGQLWHAIRRGELPFLPHYSPELNNLLRSMVHPDPMMRPSAAAIIQHPTLCPYAKKSRAQLRRELNEEKFKNELLSRQLKEAQEMQSAIQQTVLPSIPACPEPETIGALGTSNSRKKRLIGRKVNRSMSLTWF